jgi:sporulation protein YlmC with PRC-barrel domain
LLGHVFDLRCHWTAGQVQPPLVEALVFGHAGWLRRVGFSHTHALTVPWSAVEAVRDDGVVVVDAARVRRDGD